MKRNRTFGIVARVACVLLCLVLFSAHLCSGMFARYNSEGEAEGSARVAALNVMVEEEEDLEVPATGNATYSFTVNNQSEVAVAYDLVVKFKAASTLYNTYGADVMKDVITDVKIGNVSGTSSSDGKTYTFSNVGTLAPEEVSDVHNMSFKVHVVAKNTDDLGSQRVPASYLLDFDIYAKVTQID